MILSKGNKEKELAKKKQEKIISPTGYQLKKKLRQNAGQIYKMYELLYGLIHKKQSSTCAYTVFLVPQFPRFS